MNKVNDLLDKNKRDLKIKENPKTKELYIENVTEAQISTYDDIIKYVEISHQNEEKNPVKGGSVNHQYLF